MPQRGLLTLMNALVTSIVQPICADFKTAMKLDHFILGNEKGAQILDVAWPTRRAIEIGRINIQGYINSRPTSVFICLSKANWNQGMHK